MIAPNAKTALNILIPLGLVAALGCSNPDTASTEDPVVPTNPTVEVSEAAERYVHLVLAVGQHDGDYVDAYHGPAEWREAAEAAQRPLADIRAEARDLVDALAQGPASDDAMRELRRRFLGRQLESLVGRVDLLDGKAMTFDEESQVLYDAVAPNHPTEHYQGILEGLDQQLAAEGFTDGSFLERYNAFRSHFVIPPDKLDAVFQAAIDACRERTAPWIELPPDESFVVEYVNDKPWSGYNWYQGDFKSLIQVNTDLPIYIDRAIDLACHEGYPGHHVYNVLLEKHLRRDRGWIEFSVYPLFSPQSLIAEGSANYGIDMAFPGDERIAFEKEVLFPLAGLDPAKAEGYYRVQEEQRLLGYAGNEAARRYLDGEIDAEAAAEWLTQYAASEPARAAQRVRFFDTYRSYVINYNLGQDLVADWVERQAGDAPADRWRVFGQLLSSPRLPSDLMLDPGSAESTPSADGSTDE